MDGSPERVLAPAITCVRRVMAGCPSSRLVFMANLFDQGMEDRGLYTNAFNICAQTAKNHYTLTITTRRNTASFLSEMPDKLPLSSLCLPGMFITGFPLE